MVIRNKLTALALSAIAALIVSCTPDIRNPVLPRAEQEIRKGQDVENAIQQFKEKEAWLTRYYRHAPDGSYLSGETGCDGKPCYDVVVATAASREEANQIMDGLNTDYPIAFQLWSTQNPAKPYAVVAAIGLPQEEAIQLAHKLNREYADQHFDARGWRWPKFTSDAKYNLNLPF